MAAGKSSLAAELTREFNGTALSTRDLVRSLVPTASNERSSLQRAGEKLETETKGHWIATAARALANEQANDQVLVVDTIRTAAQLEALRNEFGPAMIHVHVTAPVHVLKQRYLNRGASADDFERARHDPIESRVDELAEAADIVLDSGTLATEQMVERFRRLVESSRAWSDGRRAHGHRIG